MTESKLESGAAVRAQEDVEARRLAPTPAGLWEQYVEAHALSQALVAKKATRRERDTKRNQLLNELTRFVMEIERAEDGCLGPIVDLDCLLEWIDERKDYYK